MSGWSLSETYVIASKFNGDEIPGTLSLMEYMASERDHNLGQRPTILEIYFFYLKNIFVSIFIKINRKTKHTVCTSKGWLNARTALGHMLMPSSQCCTKESRKDSLVDNRFPRPIKNSSY